MLLTAGWLGKELFDISHLTGKAIVRLNNRHPFMTEAMEPMRRMAELDTEEVDPAEAQKLIRTAHLGLELLFIAYAKAENIDDDSDDAFDDPRRNWGRSLRAFCGKPIAVAKTEDKRIVHGAAQRAAP